MRRMIELGAIVSLVATVCAPANAQSMPWINPAYTSVYAKDDVTSRQLDDIKQSQKRFPNVDSLNSVIAEQNAAAPVGPSTFNYRYSRQLTEQNLRNFVARTPDPVGRSELEKFLSGQPTLIEDIRVGIRSYGYDSHNVADAYAMWMMMSWLAAEGRLEDPDREMAQNVAAQVRSSFAATPDFAKTTDAERQEYAEALLVQSIILAELLKATQGNPEQSSQLSSMARKGAQESGLDLSKIALTRKGFVPRKGADASGAADENPVRNARANAPDDKGEGSSLGLALAAGAGLGVTLLGGLALLRRG